MRHRASDPPSAASPRGHALARQPGRALGLALGIASGLVLAACTSPPVAPTTGPGTPGAAAPTRVVAGRSVEGRPLELATLGAGPRTAFVLASIHGDEGLGTPLVEAVWDHLLRHPELLDGLRLVLLPVANPDGLAADTRGNARGVDLNRNFPAANRRDSARHGRAALSEPEARVVHDAILQAAPDLVLTLHQTRRDLPLGFIDYDGPAGEVARAITDHSELELQRLGARPGSLGSWVGLDLGLPIVTIELSRAADALSPEERWARLSPTVLEPLRWLRERPAAVD